MFGGRAKGDAGAGPEEQRTARRGMEEQGQMGLPALGERRRRAAHLKAIVHAQAAVPIGRLNDSHGPHHALTPGAKLCLGREPDEAQIGRQRENHGAANRHRERNPAVHGWHHQQIAGRKRDERPFRA